MNHRTTAAALASCALAVAALTACGSGEPAASPKEPAAGTAPAAATPSAEGSAASGEPGGGTPSAPTTNPPSGGQEGAGATASALPPRPDRDGEAAYVRALTAIDPDIVHDKEDKAVERGRAQCATIHDFPGDREKQIGTAMRRFTSPGHPEGFGRAKTTRIVDAVHLNLCPDY